MLGLSRTWKISLGAGTNISVIALDIAGAFDRVWHARLLNKLKSYGIKGHLLRLIEDYLIDCQDRVFKNRHASKFH